MYQEDYQSEGLQLPCWEWDECSLDVPGPMQTPRFQRDILPQHEASQTSTSMSISNPSFHFIPEVDYSRGAYMPTAHSMSALEHPFPEHPPSWDSLNSIEMMEQFQITGFPENPKAQTMAATDQSTSPPVDNVHRYRRLPPLARPFMGHSAASMLTHPSHGFHYNYSSSPREHCINKSSAKFECVVCNTRFTCESSAKRHQENQVKRFRCAVCGELFARRDYRNWHQRRCHGPNSATPGRLCFGSTSGSGIPAGSREAGRSEL